MPSGRSRAALWCVAFTLTALAGCGDQDAGEVPPAADATEWTPGCGPPDPISEPTEFVPYDGRKGSGPPQLEVTAEPVTEELLSRHPFVATLDSLPAAGVVTWPNNGQVSVIYAEDLPGMDPSPAVHDGGLVLEILPIPGATWDAERQASLIPRGATVVDIGPYEGVINWADETEYGTRPHYLQWGRGSVTWRLIGVRPAEELVTLARSLECPTG